MIDDIRKDPLAAALRAVVEEKIASLDLDALTTYADRVYDATPNEYELDSELELALVYALREARGHVADDARTAGRLEEARKRRPGESDDEYRARMTAFGLDDGSDELVQPADDRWFTMSWPLMPGDEGMSREDIVLKYNLLHVVAHLGGMRLDELQRLAGPAAWETLSEWVDGVRGGKMSDPVLRRAGESPADYARRMRLLITTIAGLVREEAGQAIDAGVGDIDFVMTHFHDEGWPEAVELQKSIKTAVSRIADPVRLRSVLDFINSET